jgi:hypothetical protein
MPSKKTPSTVESQNQLIAEARRHQAQQEQTYRGQALKLYPCGPGAPSRFRQQRTPGDREETDQ